MIDLIIITAVVSSCLLAVLIIYQDVKGWKHEKTLKQGSNEE